MEALRKEKCVAALEAYDILSLEVSISCSDGLVEEVILGITEAKATDHSKVIVQRHVSSSLDVQISGADFQLKQTLIQWLENYLDKKSTQKPLPYDFRNLTPFERSVLYAIEKIPFGEVRTYKEIAEEVERPLAARAVGMACGKNPFPLFIPCHRVVASSGEGGYTPDIAIKRFFLRHEGVL